MTKSKPKSKKANVTGRVDILAARLIVRRIELEWPILARVIEKPVEEFVTDMIGPIKVPTKALEALVAKEGEIC